VACSAACIALSKASSDPAGGRGMWSTDDSQRGDGLGPGVAARISAWARRRSVVAATLAATRIGGTHHDVRQATAADRGPAKHLIRTLAHPTVAKSLTAFGLSSPPRPG
jgi:hypothetical protein